MDLRGRSPQHTPVGRHGEVCRRTLRLTRCVGEKNDRGILESMATRKKFLSDATHRIRFVYLPKHSSWLNQIEIVFGIIHRKLLRGGNFTSVTDLESQLREFMDYYNATMAHPFAWTYTGKPVQKQRRASFVAPHRRLKLGKIQQPVKAVASSNAVEEMRH